MPPLHHPPPPSRSDGFTLAELAIVLLIVSLLLSGMTLTFSAQSEAMHYRQARQAQEDIKAALLGFAATHGRLPCPDLDTDPQAPGYGIEEASCDGGAASNGYLPWKTLGSDEVDPWGNHRTVAADPDRGRWRYRVDSAFTVAIGLTTSPSSTLSVVDRNGTALTNNTPADRPIAVLFSTGPDGVANGRNDDANPTEYAADTPGQGFDDLVLWISRPLLYNRLIAAGRGM